MYQFYWEVCPVNQFRAILRRRRRALGSLALALAVAAVFWAVNSPAVIGASASERSLPIYQVKRDNKAVSLSFDAACGNIIFV